MVHSTGNDCGRLHTHELEIGVTEAVQHHITRKLVARRPVSQRKLDFERHRPRWLRECMAEATGVFFYVFPGIASIASLILNAESKLGATAYGSLFQIGCAFGLGIAFAVITCASTSGGHFHPAITLCLAFWQGFPWKKVPHYICSQIFGAFMAAMLVMGMYWVQINEYKEALLAAGSPLVSSSGPASILCIFPGAGQTNLGYVFMIEFFACTFIAIVIWAVMDPANPFVSPAGAPFVIGLAYSAMIWGFGDVSVSMNLARDLGTRIVAAIFFGREAFTYMGYAPIGVLVNVPATFLATAFYELLMRDSMQAIGKGYAVHEGGEDGLLRHIDKTGLLDMDEVLKLRRGVDVDFAPTKQGDAV